MAKHSEISTNFKYKYKKKTKKENEEKIITIHAMSIREFRIQLPP